MLNNGKLDAFGAKDITASDAPLEVKFGGPDFTMNSKVHISIVAVGKNSRFAAPMVQIDGLDPEEKTKQTVFTWFDKEGKLCVACQSDHDEWLKQQADAYYQRYAARWS